MSNFLKASMVAALAFKAITFSAAYAEEPAVFDTPGTSLTGKLLRNYVMLGSGEMLKGNILYLEEPISIEGNPESEKRANKKKVKNVQQILVSFEPEIELSDDIMGDTVLLTGRLFNEPSDAHHTKVLMKADGLKVIEEMTGEGPVATFKTH